jgi:hypothetical protein
MRSNTELIDMSDAQIQREIYPRLSAEHSLEHSLNALCIATEAEIQHRPIESRRLGRRKVIVYPPNLFASAPSR